MDKILQEKYKKVAIKALEQYDIQYDNIEFLTQETNVFFEVQGKEKVVIKICQEDSSIPEDNYIEAFFLDLVTNNTDIQIPSIIRTKSNDVIAIVDTEDFDVPKRTIVYKYVEGVDFFKRETDELFYELGKITAKLHNATEHHSLPEGLNPRVWNNVFYFKGEVPVYHHEKYSEYFTKEDVKLLDDIIAYLNKHLMKYKEEKNFLIHGDLNPWNVRLHEGKIKVLDFEDCIMGTAVQDICITLFYYRYNPNRDFKKIRSLYLDGYKTIREVREISDFEMDLLMLARTCNFVNFVLVIDDFSKEYIDRCLKRIKDFIKTYDVKL